MDLVSSCLISLRLRSKKDFKQLLFHGFSKAVHTAGVRKNNQTNVVFWQKHHVRSESERVAGVVNNVRPFIILDDQIRCQKHS